jgi:uncharacterized iron-regulated membrane protein
MNRSFWIKAHLFAAAFFAPVLIIIATSGGLYLLGIKGSVKESTVPTPAGASLNLDSDTLDADVTRLLADAGITHEFEYLRAGGNSLTTRPTSTTYYVLKVTAEEVEISRNEPSLQKSMIELHKGHGPVLFKEFQKFMAAALLFVLLSGTWLGLSSKGLRNKTLATMGGGLVAFLTLAFFI